MGLQVSYTNKWLIATFTVLIVYLMPYVVLSENLRLTAWDNLDSIFVWYKTLLDSGLVFSGNHSEVVGFMSGIPRGSLPTELNFTTIFYVLFGPLGSYIIERFIINISAFVGMELLLRKHILNNETFPPWYIPMVSLCFAILPFWPYGGMSVAGLPLIFYSFFNFRSGKMKKSDWLILFIYAFYSNVVLVGVFVLILFALIFLYDYFICRQWNRNTFLALLFLTILYILSSYRLFFSFLISSNYISHRVEFQQLNLIEEPLGLLAALNLLKQGQEHSVNLIFPFVLIVIIIGSFIAFKARNLPRKLVYILLFLVGTSILFGLQNTFIFAPIDQAIKRLLPIEYVRFYMLHPVLWYISFAITGKYVLHFHRFGKYIMIPILFLQLLMGFYKSEPINNEFRYRFYNSEVPSFKEFFAEPQFEEVKKRIGLPIDSYKVASVGMHPSISLFNGFHTIDGYCADYPLSYKHKFRRIIEAELDKNQEKKNYFDKWGSRAYIFTEQDFGQMMTKKMSSGREIKNLELNIQVLCEMNCRYVLSALKINQETSKGLVFIKKFIHENSAWDIWLYEVKCQ